MLEVLVGYALSSLEIFFVYILPFLIIITIIVFFHELGHYWIARRNGVKIEVFSIGFGPEIFGRTDKHGTRWKFCPILAGGYVKMMGEDGGTDELADSSLAFSAKSVGVRMRIAVAGPIANIVLALLIYILSFMVIGEYQVGSVIGEVPENTPAAEAGFIPGDHILSINNIAIDTATEVQQQVARSGNSVMSFLVDRNGQRVTIEVTPRINAQGKYFIGVGFRKGTFVRLDPISAVLAGIHLTYKNTTSYAQQMGSLVTGAISTDELAGPIGIGQITGNIVRVTVESGNFVFIFYFVAFLSIAIGFINLLPIPGLDGGLIMFCAVEAIKGSPVSKRAQEIYARIGIGFILALMVLATLNDLMRIF